MFKQYLNDCAQTTLDALEQILSARSAQAEQLHQAMHYSLTVGGKRVRPMLAYASAEALGSSRNSDLIKVACALECLHTYSLVHDDLPAMDDDDLRRGKPTCHIAFDEATAILAGDALQTLAFELLTDLTEISSRDQIAVIKTLALASGDLGMVAGQAIDLSAVDSQLSLDELKHMHRLKTGALICASVRMGAQASGNSTPKTLAALDDYACAIGLAFQIQDDILDVTADTQTLGKTQGADMALNKPTYVSLLGLEGAQNAAQELLNQALAALSSFDEGADPLRQLAKYIVEREF